MANIQGFTGLKATAGEGEGLSTEHTSAHFHATDISVKRIFCVMLSGVVNANFTQIEDPSEMFIISCLVGIRSEYLLYLNYYPMN